MADFNTPFASQAGRRTPNADEKVNGFPCGPADQTLFNGMFYRLESEIGNVISYAGLTGSDADYSQLRKAITALIDAATGAGDTDSYILLSQAAARLPLFPEIVSSEGRINVTSPAGGTVRVPGNVDLIHRGIRLVTTEETDFATVSSKTYHIRWNPVNGFTLNDLSDPVYNPLTLGESDPAFDTNYDDMLVARVVTNSSNVASITTLANLQRLRYRYTRAAVFSNAEVNDPSNTETIAYNFARTPDFLLHGFSESSITGPSDDDGSETNIYLTARSRYSASVFTYSRNSTLHKGGRPAYEASFACLD